MDSRGHYEIVDERNIRGDYVLTGGELPALVLVDCVVRMLRERFRRRIAMRTRAIIMVCWNIHSTHVLRCGTTGKCLKCLSGNHAEIAKWRREEAVKATYLKRPELLERSPLTEKDLAIIHKLEEKENKK